MSKAQTLVILEVYKNGQVRKYEVEKAEFVLGRGNNSEVPLDEPGVSREHIKIIHKKSSLYLVDLNSSNGTSVNQIKLAPNVPREIEPFDVIRLGNTSVTLKIKIFEFTDEVKHELSTIIPDQKNSTPDIPQIKSAPSETPSVSPLPTEADPSDFSNNLPIAPNPVDAVASSAEPEKPEAPPQPKKFNLAQPNKPTGSLSQDLARDALKEIEDAKLSILKSADLQKQKIIEEAKRLAKQEIHSAFAEHEKSMEFLLEETRKEVAKLKDDAEHIIQDRKKQAQEEIEKSWKEHQDAIADAKENYLEKIDRDNKHKLEILKEKLHAEAYAERNRLITKAEGEILARKRAYQDEADADKKVYIDQINDLNNEIAEKRKELTKVSDDIEQQISNKIELENSYQRMLEANEKDKKAFEQEKAQKLDEFNYERLKALETIQVAKDDLVAEKERLDKELKLYEQDISEQKDKIKLSVQDSIKEIDEQHKKLDVIHREIELELSKRKQVENDIAKLKKEIEDLSPLKQTALNELQEITQKVAAIADKKNQLQEQFSDAQKLLFEEKNKLKHDLDLEYQTLRHTEQVKFDEFKAKQLKELQKVRDEHAKSIQTMGQSLSKEIAHNLELQYAKNNNHFEYEDSLELINSIIQVKSAGLTGDTPAQSIQIDNYQSKRRKEKIKTLFSGALVGISMLYIGNLIYVRLTTDPMVAEMAQMKEERQKREIANKYTPEKTEKYFDDYVDSTIYTKDFADTYLNDTNQREWVQFATKYFLKNWKVEEEKTIKVISATRALVQNIQEAEDSLRKSTLKQDIDKLKDLEKDLADSNSKILGSSVRLEAYKKHEKNFFMKKMGYRLPASR